MSDGFLMIQSQKETSLACMTCFLKLPNETQSFGQKFNNQFNMIDTIILLLPKEQAKATIGSDPWSLQSRTPAYDKFVKNPSKKNTDSGRYFPRLTGFNRKMSGPGWSSTTRIEFSAPKLIYENNLDELTEDQFDKVAQVLQDRILEMGVIISLDDLKNASVKSVHYSKNIELQNGYTSQYVLGELGKINLNQRFDMTRARYINDGQSLYAYTKAHSLVIYDKIADLARSPKRAIDREQTLYQLSLFDDLKRSVQEILRIEARLSEKRKMNSLFEKLGFAKNPTFRDVFSTQKSRAVLLYYWETMITKNGLMLFAHAPTNKDLLRQIITSRKKMKGKQAIYLAGLILLARDGNGLRELRSVLSRRVDSRTWYRIMDDLNMIALDLKKLKPREWYDQVYDAISNYKPVHIKQVDM